MISKVLLDTGPLVALVDKRDRYHAWSRAQVGVIKPPLLTCEAVLTEACHLLRNLSGAPEAVLEMVKRGLVTVTFLLGDEVERVTRLIVRYASVPMSLADACLVRMTEQFANSTVLTLDSDFRVYRRNGRQIIPSIMPNG